MFVYLAFLILIQKDPPNSDNSLPSASPNPPRSTSDMNRKPSVHPARASHVFPRPVSLRDMSNLLHGFLLKRNKTIPDINGSLI